LAPGNGRKFEFRQKRKKEGSPAERGKEGGGMLDFSRKKEQRACLGGQGKKLRTARKGGGKRRRGTPS